MHRGNYYSPKRRSLMAMGEDINHCEIFERDNWTCGICGGAIDKRLRKPNHYAATIDHIIPCTKWLDDMSKWHSRLNVQAAHWICNMRKSDAWPDNTTSPTCNSDDSVLD